MSEASGVVGVGEGDLEHAVVDEDDIEIEDGEGGKTEAWNGPSLSAWWDTAPVVLPIGFLRKRTHVSGLPQRSIAEPAFPALRHVPGQRYTYPLAHGGRSKQLLPCSCILSISELEGIQWNTIPAPTKYFSTR